jgi:hypothetical protein
MANKNVSSIVSVPTHVSFDVTIRVHQTNYRWNDPSGQDAFSVTLPLESVDALNLSKLVPGMISTAKIAFEQAWNEQEAKKAAEAQLEAENMAAAALHLAEFEKATGL